ncbi:MAG: ABC transporter substrate-binding protein [Acidimicrobiales bacterium]
MHRTRMRAWRSVVALATAALLVVACGGADDDDTGSPGTAGESESTTSGPAASGEPIRIGFIGPFSGNAAFATAAVKQTLDVWVDEVNADGGILGRPVETVERDDQASPELTLQVARELVEDGVGIIIGPVTNATALQPLQQELDFINFTILSRVELADGTQFPNTFNTYPANRLTINFLLDYLPAEGLTDWALLADTSPNQQQYFQAFTADAEGAGADIVYSNSFDSQSIDLSPVVQEVAGSGADVILFFAVGATVGRFLQAIATAGVDTPIYSSAAISASDLSVAPPEVLAEQVYEVITQTAVLEDGEPAEGLEPLTLALYDAVGRENVKGTGLVIQFEAFEMMRYAIEEAGAPDPAAMRQVMNGVTNQSFLTPRLEWTFSTTDHGGYTDDPRAGLGLARPVPSSEWPGYRDPAVAD